MTADHAGTPKSVLIVEDDPDVRESLYEILEDEGYLPLVASNGQEGLDRLREAVKKPCLVLLDMMMPVMDGWAFRSAQRSDPEIASIPVVLLTAHANVEQAAEQMNAAGFLKKPIGVEHLLSTVARYCAGS